jgi:hypothetical protein
MESNNKFYLYSWTINESGRPVLYFASEYDNLFQAMQTVKNIPYAVNYRIISDSKTVTERIY